MAITVRDVLLAIEAWAPYSLAEQWDNVGLQIGSCKKVVLHLGVALDLTLDILDLAISEGIDCIITHHPFLFTLPRSIDLDSPFGKILSGLIIHDIALIAAHTNLDSTDGGVSDVLAEALRVRVEGVLREARDISSEKRARFLGLGRIGTLEQETTVFELAKRVAEVSCSKIVQIIGNETRLVKSVALCSGAGGDLLPEVIKSGAEVYITGEMKYHQLREAEAFGLSVILAGHFETEYLILPKLTNYLMDWVRKEGEDIKITQLRDKAPLKPLKI